jgi:hypothetical protein
VSKSVRGVAKRVVVLHLPTAFQLLINIFLQIVWGGGGGQKSALKIFNQNKTNPSLQVWGAYVK